MSNNVFDKYWTNSIIKIIWVIGLILLCISFFFYSWIIINLSVPETAQIFQVTDSTSLLLLGFLLGHIAAIIFFRVILESLAIQFEIRNELKDLNKKADWKLEIDKDDC